MEFWWRELIRAAHEDHCKTIVVGYNAYSWIKEKLHTHIAEQLIAQSERRLRS
ncbi:MAG TPA: hypothetical protein VF452_12715 [Candidatus Binatia bacterium]